MVTLRPGWRTRVREGVAAVVTFAGGVVAATAGAPWTARAVGAVVFLVGTYLLLDGLILAASWRSVGRDLKVPTLRQRQRVIARHDDLAVTAVGAVLARLRVSGPRGERLVMVNPLISPRDVHTWLAAAT